jgi:hypothetical protein
MRRASASAKRCQNSLMRCGQFFLAGCFSYSHHAPDESHYLRQIEHVFRQGFVDEHLRSEAIEQLGSFRWGDGYGGRELCVELEDGWKHLAALHQSLSVARWYAQIDKFPTAGVEPIRSFLLTKLRNQIWQEHGFRYREGPGWTFDSSKIVSLRLVTWVVQRIHKVGPAPVSYGLLRKMRQSERKAYSRDCRPTLIPYFSAIQRLQEEAHCPPEMIVCLKRRGLGLAMSPKDKGEYREWDALLRESKLLNYG